VRYAESKQLIFEELIAGRQFRVYPDALHFARALIAAGVRLAVASSSNNANEMMHLIHLPGGQTLLDLFETNVCGRDPSRGKPHPQIFLTAAAELGVAPAKCLVVEDAPAGIEAAHAGGMKALGVARLGDAALLRDACADLVVSALDEVDMNALVAGRLAARAK
jgi:beta-phosphoglucomutase